MTRLAGKKRKKGSRQHRADVFNRRAERAGEMAKSPTMTVTLRIPSAFNQWLDAYRHLSYPEKVAKQDLVVEGLTMSYLRRGMPGEAVLESPKLATRRRPRS